MLLNVLIKCLLITILIEFIGAIIIGIRDKKDILIIILINILTNPILNIIYLIVTIYLKFINEKIALYILEVLVVVIEGVIYKKYFEYKKINPFIISIILNTLSYSMDIILE